ncbi:MAG: nucleotidyltransferase domain-containing protein [Desulfobacteraceae bacterium]|nr:MAG: nucleotidyltransferase domain-containing protein [Desulfobacteraceae bacterium]
MRLTDSERMIIKAAAKRIFGLDARIFLFGSRVDNSRKGGDIDLYVETEHPTMLQDKISFITHLKLDLGDQKIDVVVNAPNKNDQKIFHNARKTGIEL